MGIGDWEFSSDSSLFKLLLLLPFAKLLDKKFEKERKNHSELVKTMFNEEEERSKIDEIAQNSDKYFYCKYCGNIEYPPNNIGEFYNRFAKCKYCGETNSYVFSDYSRKFYEENSIEHKCVYWSATSSSYTGCLPKDLLFIKEIENIPSFSEGKYRAMSYRRAGVKTDPHPKFHGMRCTACKSFYYYKLIVPQDINTKYRYACKKCGYRWY